jgi:transcription-repair coupling factor (superfamily II helicase)
VRGTPDAVREEDRGQSRGRSRASSTERPRAEEDEAGLPGGWSGENPDRLDSAGDGGEIDPDLVVTSWRPDAEPRGLEEGGPSFARRPSPVPEIPPGEPIVMIDCGLNHGFVLTDIGLVVVTEREIFGEEVRAAPEKRRKGAAFISDFRDLKPGDLVVHVDHGVGRYQGLARPPASPRDFMLLQYADDARLYVPVDRLDLVQKYGAGDGSSRSLDKLGGPGWERVRGRVKKAVRDMTKELLELYATRKAIAGRPFTSDTAWQREFEDGFPFVLTPDQERAIAEVKADLESEKPMERLLCGDVGYGKTEVAMRAAFKVVQDGSQVAILAPTTVLALQHSRTFRERFAPFPVTVEMLSRLRTPREQKDVVARLAEGKVDILIGTQRLLSKDVVFRDLGLLIVDEEQRFGVAHKERLKQMSIGIDTLAMSATPIPRTLQMSMAGVRDLSVIETPPMNRLAIQTNLLPYNRGTVAAAIRSELHRGGQVYFVHNRVESIHRIAARIQELVPEARFAVTHGQMDVRSLEGTMVRFLRGDIDVLVSTTIIENGLDIPRVNTLIVNRADRFGLSQLYQLRGRVGRSDVRAYAYFIVPSRRTLTPLARRRLLALQEFSDLGAGFRIAALDLELRGAGDLLGARQHGHIAALGFDLYMKMLEEAVREYEGAAPIPEAATFNLGVDIRIPDTYVPEPNLRLALYKRIASARGAEELGEIRAEVEDRFGKLPRSGANLFDLAGLRLEAGRLGVRTVEFAEGRLAFRFIEKPAVSPERVIRFLGRQGFASISPTGLLSVPAPPDPDARIEAARVVLQGLAG